MQTISKTVRLGNIPQKLIIVGRVPQKLAVNWYDYKDESSSKEMVIPAFAVPENSEAFLKTARSWAKSYFSQEDQGNKGHSETRVYNTPQNGYRIVGLDIRCEGGRAYKVLDKSGRMFDLREDVLFDCMIEEGIDVGGCLKSKFLWGQVGSQMRLIRENSEMHKLLLEATAKKELKPISKKHFEVGGIYRQRNGLYAIYLGQVNLTNFGFDFVVKRTKNISMFLFVEEWKLRHYPNYPATTPRKIWDDVLNTIINIDDNHFRFTYQKSITVIEKVGNVIVPADFIELVRNYGLKKAIKDFNKNKIGMIDRQPLLNYFMNRSDMICLSPADKWMGIPKEIQNEYGYGGIKLP